MYMRTCSKPLDVAASLVWLVMGVVLMAAASTCAGSEETFPVLQIGTRMYTNVTVTTKAKNYIFIVHAGGMNNIKTAELPADVREKLGYGEAERAKAATNGTIGWAKAEVAKLQTPQIKDMTQKLNASLHGRKQPGLALSALLPWKLLIVVMAVALGFYLFQCYCFMLICQKTGNPPGVLVWIPVLQIFPLLRAAGMSGWWFVGFLVPVVSLVASVLWAVNISKARGKSGWVALFVILPVTYPFAILYLAFSGGGATEEDEAEPQVMTLQPV
jgi:hypothetical protein